MHIKENLFIEKFLEIFNIDELHLTPDYIKKIWNDKVVRLEIMKLSEGIVINSVTLVKNQEINITKSIASSNGISDKIFIFDTGSEDNTVNVVKEIIKKNPKIVLNEIEWVDDFSYMRNKVRSYVPHGWIFSIDSDEKIIGNIDKGYLKLSLAMFEYLFPDDDIVLSFKQIGGSSKIVNWADRFYKTSPSINYFGVVHEELRSTQTLIKVKTQYTLLNEGRTDQEREKFDKEKRYYRLLAENIDAEPENIKWVALLPFDEGMKQSEKYTSILERFVDLIKNENVTDYNYNDTFFEETLLANYIKSLIHLNKIDEAIIILKFSKNRYPSNSTFIAINYLIVNLSLQEQAIVEITNLKKDLQKFKIEDSIWNSYSSIEELEELSVKLLFKAEQYSSAFDLIQNMIGINFETSLISKEVLLLNREAI